MTTQMLEWLGDLIHGGEFVLDVGARSAFWRWSRCGFELLGSSDDAILFSRLFTRLCSDGFRTFPDSVWNAGD